MGIELVNIQLGIFTERNKKEERPHVCGDRGTFNLSLLVLCKDNL